jgi:predicted Zn-dependent protease
MIAALLLILGQFGGTALDPCPACGLMDCRWPSATIRVGLDRSWPAALRPRADAALAEACAAWSGASGLRFRVVPERSFADVWLRPAPIDGPGRTFGVAQWPCVALRSDRVADVRIDEADLDRITGAWLAHELGHALGLRHTLDPADLMCPVVPGDRAPDPSPADARAIGALYPRDRDR